MKMRSTALHRERGVAIVTALLLTSLTVMLVTSLFWQQQVQARSLENQRLRLQTQWLLRSTLDWARVMLREDSSRSSVDHLDEQWATPLTATDLEQYIQDSGANREMDGAVLSGNIIDAQSRYNLRNLAIHGTVNPEAVAVFQRLLSHLSLDSSFAQSVAEIMAAQSVPPVDGTGAAASNQARRIPGMQTHHIDDLLAIPGLTPEILGKLKQHVVILPVPTEINVNTASATVLSARIAGLSMEDAQALVASRKRIFLRDGADLTTRSSGKVPVELANTLVFASSFFIVNGKVRVRHSAVDMQALLERNMMLGTRILWIRED